MTEPPGRLLQPPAGMEQEEEVMEASWFRSRNGWGRRGVPRGSGTQFNTVTTTSCVRHCAKGEWWGAEKVGGGQGDREVWVSKRIG